tara:strand:+ start:241 stop:687 length:447 start_codon:yes stop_codon:yes gene_type:complete
MALTTRQRNNIILFTCIFFILILNITDRLIRNSQNYLPLFDEEYQLERVEFLGLVWQSNQLSWQCNFTHIECISNGMFWQELQASPIDIPKDTLHSNYVIRFTLKNPETVLVWYWYPEQALLQSHSKHWYKLPMLAQHKLKYFVENQK